LALQRSFYSTIHTGFVFAGFGSSQLFPALKSFQFDGIIFGMLKRLQLEIVSIDTNRVRARIVPFAQREMVDRFLFGMDRHHERTIIDNVRRNIEDLGNAILGSLPGIRRKTRERLRENIRAAVDSVITDLQDTPFKN
jgi:ABC-type amino acid transport substrate-binding protein